jgi:DNA-binding NtrC family response regulator
LNASSSPLALVPFAHPDADAAMRAALDALGYQPRVLSPAQVNEGAMDGWPGMVVFLLGAAGRRDHVLAAMESARAMPSLALLVTGEAVWEPELIERCCDCARWPCAEDELAFRLKRLCHDRRPASESLDPDLAATLGELNLIGRSPSFLDAIGRVRRLAQCAAPVLIEGETGTGKELVARALHYLGGRADGPFVPVNCGALPDHLVENELFGHERGAYTDARSAAVGAIGEAAGGTLFLDEVEALSPKAQAALLRFLQNKEYRPLGGQRVRHADTRVVTASNADLRALSAQQGFRADLYFRLNILSLRLPPLRERVDDIDLLARHFVEQYCRQYGLPAKTLDPRTVRLLRAYHWPGNVRELENLIHREVLLATGKVLQILPGADSSPRIEPFEPDAQEIGGISFAEAKSRAVAVFERDYLIRLMAETQGNVTRAARVAGKERRALGKLLKKYGVTAAAADQTMAGISCTPTFPG